MARRSPLWLVTLRHTSRSQLGWGSRGPTKRTIAGAAQIPTGVRAANRWAGRTLYPRAVRTTDLSPDLALLSGHHHGWKDPGSRAVSFQQPSLQRNYRASVQFKYRCVRAGRTESATLDRPPPSCVCLSERSRRSPFVNERLQQWGLVGLASERQLLSSSVDARLHMSRTYLRTS